MARPSSASHGVAPRPSNWPVPKRIASVLASAPSRSASDSSPRDSASDTACARARVGFEAARWTAAAAQSRARRRQLPFCTAGAHDTSPTASHPSTPRASRLLGVHVVAQDVCAPLDRRRRRRRVVGAALVPPHKRGDGVAVRHHVPIEPPLPAQQALEAGPVGAHGGAVDRVVSAHDAARLGGAHAGVERWQVGVGQVLRASEGGVQLALALAASSSARPPPGRGARGWGCAPTRAAAAAATAAAAAAASARACAVTFALNE